MGQTSSHIEPQPSLTESRRQGRPRVSPITRQIPSTQRQHSDLPRPVNSTSSSSNNVRRLSQFLPSHRRAVLHPSDSARRRSNRHSTLTNLPFAFGRFFSSINSRYGIGGDDDYGHNDESENETPSTLRVGTASRQRSRAREEDGNGQDIQMADVAEANLVTGSSSPSSEARSMGSPESPLDALPPRSAHSNREPSRMGSLRLDRTLRQFASHLRRRHSSRDSASTEPTAFHDHQTLMLTDLLAAAAAATAATLMGDHQAIRDARSTHIDAHADSPDPAEDDGTFEGFIRALQNGRMASALRQNDDSDENPREGSLNFFRMFRFGAAVVNRSETRSRTRQQSGQTEAGEEAAEDRMVPIIIVGIRAIPPESTSTSVASDIPPFAEALANLPHVAPNPSEGRDHQTIDAILRPPQNGTSFSHRRRASMGQFGLRRSRMSDPAVDVPEPRQPESQTRYRPVSMSSRSIAPDPSPPPATPASPSSQLSRISSQSNTPSHSRSASLTAANSYDMQIDDHSSSDSARANPSASGTMRNNDSSPAQASQVPNRSYPPGSSNLSDRPVALRRSDTAPHVHYPRFASGHPRRNGVVEPDHFAGLSSRPSVNNTDSRADDESSSTGQTHVDRRSWIIYVLGGSYPENHPILTTPSLFSDNPTYEDMMLLSALLGPAKAPTASNEDVESAGGLYVVRRISDHVAAERSAADAVKTMQLVAMAANGERVELQSDQRCLVCLCDYEENDQLRQLKHCDHLFHQECIDQVSFRPSQAQRHSFADKLQWLTQGRNSCPLCRGLGVVEKEQAVQSGALPPTASVPVEDMAWGT